MENVYKGQIDKFIFEYGIQGAQLFFARLLDIYNVKQKDKAVASAILERWTKALLEYDMQKKIEKQGAQE